MSSTWADDQFDKLEAAYDEVPIEAKARISELEAALNEVADKWAQAQIEAEDYARRNRLLESLVRDWYELYEEPDYGDCCRLMHRMRELGIEVDT